MTLGFGLGVLWVYSGCFWVGFFDVGWVGIEFVAFLFGCLL